MAFPLSDVRQGPDWAEAAVQKDAGDDPDVTHGVHVHACVERSQPGDGITFAAGEGVGMVTKPGLPIPPGEPAINPVPRAMIQEAVRSVGLVDARVTLSIPNGAEIAGRTWNPRLGIEGGLSILGTTGIVRPFSCAAWIASIHRGIDVARATGLTHAVGATGATSEAAAQRHFGLPDHGMLDMGDFAGGMLKYLRRHPIQRVTIAGGMGKLSKLAQGALDLHSARSQVDFEALARRAAEAGEDAEAVRRANTALEAFGIAPGLATVVARDAAQVAQGVLGDAPLQVDVMVIDRKGTILARSRE